MSNAEYDKSLYQIMNKAGEYVNENFSDGDNELLEPKDFNHLELN